MNRKKFNEAISFRKSPSNSLHHFNLSLNTERIGRERVRERNKRQREKERGREGEGGRETERERETEKGNMESHRKT